MSADGTLVVIMVWPPESVFREHAGDTSSHAFARSSLRFRTRASESSLRARPTDAVVERKALQSDLSIASLACVVLVSLVVVLFFGSPARIAPDGRAGAARRRGRVRSRCARVRSAQRVDRVPRIELILGNGINAAIIQLARYEEERRSGTALDGPIERSVLATVRATATASLAAAMAYGSLTVTSFRGFSQFGVIGAVGMIASWLATILVLPALVATIDRRRGPIRERRIAFGAPFARLVGGARGPSRSSVRLPRSALSSRRSRPRATRSSTTCASCAARKAADRRALGQRIEAIFGTFTPTTLLADSANQVRPIADVLHARSVLYPGVLGDITTLDSLLPGAPEVQQQKLALLEEIRRSWTRRARCSTTRSSHSSSSGIRRATSRRITAVSLPDVVTRPFRDTRGELAPVVLAYRASRRISYWNGRDLTRLAALVRTVESRRQHVACRRPGGGRVRRNARHDRARCAYLNARLVARRGAARRSCRARPAWCTARRRRARQRRAVHDRGGRARGCEGQLPRPSSRCR